MRCGPRERVDGWQSSSSGSCAWREAPPTSLIRLRTPQRSSKQSAVNKDRQPGSQCAPAQPDELEFTNVRQAIFEKCGSEKNDPGATRKRYSGGQSAAFRVCAGEPYYTFVPVGSNDEVKIVLVQFPVVLTLYMLRPLVDFLWTFR